MPIKLIFSYDNGRFIAPLSKYFDKGFQDRYTSAWAR